LIVDYHVHTPYCGHAHGQIIQYIQTAVQKGFQEIGFTDHLGRYYLSKVQKKRYWDWGMSERDLARYFSELSDLREVFANQIKIKIGLEIDFIEGAEDLLHKITDNYLLDFSIGSIHCMPRLSWKHLSDIENKNTDDIYAEYFRLTNAAIKSKLFQSIAHMDFIWRHLSLPKKDSDIIFSYIDETVKTASEHKMCIEVNANGLMWALAHMIDENDLFFYLLRKIKEYNVSITLGSDAHEPFFVGKAFPQLLTVLKEHGITTVSTFTEGICTLNPLG
jgi:histidinol-phosphatase (PHP family)